MLSLAITNTSSVNTIGPEFQGNEGDTGAALYSTNAFALPGFLSWVSIAASGTATVTCRVQELLAADTRLSGFTVADQLQTLVQQGLITVAFSPQAMAHDIDVSGRAVGEQGTT
jgi:hypothetical protein